MGKIYAGVTALKLIFDTGADLSHATATLNAESPSKADKTFDLTIESPATAGVVSYEVEDEDDFDEAGVWKFWISVEYENLTTTVSEAVRVRLFEAGQ